MVRVSFGKHHELPRVGFFVVKLQKAPAYLKSRSLHSSASVGGATIAIPDLA